MRNFRGMNEGSENPIFNQASLFVNRLDALSGLIDDCIKNQDLLGAYRLTERLFVRLDYKARMQETKLLFGETYKERLVEIESLLNKIHSVLSNQSSFKLNAGIVDKDIREVGKILFWLQWDMHLIMPEKISKPWQDEVKGDFQ